MIILPKLVGNKVAGITVRTKHGNEDSRNLQYVNRDYCVSHISKSDLTSTELKAVKVPTNELDYQRVMEINGCEVFYTLAEFAPRWAKLYTPLIHKSLRESLPFDLSFPKVTMATGKIF